MAFKLPFTLSPTGTGGFNTPQSSPSPEDPIMQGDPVESVAFKEGANPAALDGNERGGSLRDSTRSYVDTGAIREAKRLEAERIKREQDERLKKELEKKQLESGIDSGLATYAEPITVAGEIQDQITRFLGIEDLGAEHYAAAMGVAGGPQALSAVKNILTKAAAAGAPIATRELARSEAAYLLSQVNARTVQLATQSVAKGLSAGTMIGVGSLLLTAAGTVVLGLWSQAESPEPISIVMSKFVLPEAERTGNWDFYNEAAKQRDEILSLDIWEKIGLWTPFVSPAIGVPNKIQGAIAGAKIMDRYAADKQHQQETGETDADKWARIKEEQAQQEKDLIDYYNQERKKMIEWENKARAEARSEERSDAQAARDKEAAFWAAERERQRELEAADREAIAKFWLEYRKLAQQQADESRPSKLNFGFI